MVRLIFFLVTVLLIIYYLLLLLQVCGLIVITRRKLDGRMCIPFYYWFVSDTEKPKKK